MSAIAAQEPRLNDEIITRECRLIDFDGNQMGVYPTHQAQQIADDMNLDLVEIAPNATPPVCRIMDYGKFKYDQAIKACLLYTSRSVERGNVPIELDGG